MCFKKWFKPDPIVPVKRRALLYGINNYGGGNDLNGCLNDIDDVEKKLKGEFPDFVITKYKDAQVTCSTFFNTIKEAILVMRAGDILYIHYSGHGTQVPSSSEANGYHEALYLKDGPFIDDQIQTLQALTPEGAKVIGKFDSCFSGDLLRNPHKNRFLPLPGVTIRHKRITKFGKKKRAILRWVVFSGCGEEQTSADATFNGRANGAFTFYDNRAYNNTSTYQTEIKKLHTFLPGGGFDQSPTLDGDVSLFTNSVFT